LYTTTTAQEGQHKRVSGFVDGQRIHDNNMIYIDATKTQVNRPPRDNPFRVIYKISTIKRTSNAIPVITQDEEAANCTIGNKPRMYTNNKQTNLLQF
jgi:hypothetical protein